MNSRLGEERVCEDLLSNSLHEKTGPFTTRKSGIAAQSEVQLTYPLAIEMITSLRSANAEDYDCEDTPVVGCCPRNVLVQNQRQEHIPLKKTSGSKMSYLPRIWS